MVWNWAWVDLNRDLLSLKNGLEFWTQKELEDCVYVSVFVSKEVPLTSSVFLALKLELFK